MRARVYHDWIQLVCASQARSMKILRNTLSCAMRAIDHSRCGLMVLNAEEGIREYDKRIVVLLMKQVKDDYRCQQVGYAWKDNHTMKTGKKISVSSSNTCLTHRLSLYPLWPSNVSTNCLRWSSKSAKAKIHVYHQLSRTMSLWMPLPLTQHRQTKENALRSSMRPKWQPKPPTFVIFVNEEELMHFSYLRFPWKSNPQGLCLWRTPIHLIARKRNKSRIWNDISRFFDRMKLEENAIKEEVLMKHLFKFLL